MRDNINNILIWAGCAIMAFCTDNYLLSAVAILAAIICGIRGDE